jgi:hypothetical protein
VKKEEEILPRWNDGSGGMTGSTISQRPVSCNDTIGSYKRAKNNVFLLFVHSLVNVIEFSNLRKIYVLK